MYFSEKNPDMINKKVSKKLTKMIEKIHKKQTEFTWNNWIYTIYDNYISHNILVISLLFIIFCFLLYKYITKTNKPKSEIINNNFKNKLFYDIDSANDANYDNDTDDEIENYKQDNNIVNNNITNNNSFNPYASFDSYDNNNSRNIDILADIIFSQRSTLE